MSSEHSANLVDTHVGHRIRLRREAMGVSCGALARMLGVTVDEMSAIESGGRRARAEDLYDLARIFDVKVAFFFDYAALTEAAGKAALQEDPPRRFAQGLPG